MKIGLASAKYVKTAALGTLHISHLLLLMIVYNTQILPTDLAQNADENMQGTYLPFDVDKYGLLTDISEIC